MPCYLVCKKGAFLKWGYPLVIHVTKIFREINHLCWGTPIDGNEYMHVYYTSSLATQQPSASPEMTATPAKMRPVASAPLEDTTCQELPSSNHIK